MNTKSIIAVATIVLGFGAYALPVMAQSAIVHAKDGYGERIYASESRTRFAPGGAPSSQAHAFRGNSNAAQLRRLHDWMDEAHRQW